MSEGGIIVDVYCVLEAFDVRCPARAHAIKKLLCAGLRGKNDTLNDLKETLIAVQRAVELEEARLAGGCEAISRDIQPSKVKELSDAVGQTVLRSLASRSFFRTSDLMAKDKGSIYEREICVKLSHWWSDGKRDDIFWRSATSGARATVRGRKGKQTANNCGDMTCTDAYGAPLIDVFTIEMKRGQSVVSCHDILDLPARNKTRIFESWVLQAEDSHLLSGSFAWLLITRRDRRESMIWMEIYTRIAIEQICPLLPHTRPSVEIQLALGNRSKWIYGMRLDAFLESVRRDDIIALQRTC